MVQLQLQMALPEATAKDAVEVLRSVMLSARLDRGCTRARILRDHEASGMVTYIEEWPTPDAMAERVASDQFAKLLALMEAAPSPPTLEFRSITEVRGLDFVGAVRSRTFEWSA